MRLITQQDEPLIAVTDQKLHTGRENASMKAPKKKRSLRNMDIFLDNEVSRGRHLGSGGFANVYEVRSFRNTKDRRFSDRRAAVRRQFYEQPTTGETGEARYAIKTLKPKWADSTAAEKAIVAEAELLAKISHPNIVQVHGWSAAAMNATGPAIDGYFFVMERLSGTLEERIAAWKKEENRLTLNPFLRLFDWNKYSIQVKELLAERLQVAYDLANALSYLHEERIVYRDLKPSNIGFDEQGRCKLFDFGLSRYLPDESEMIHDAYIMSGGCGTLRFMAPETWKKRPYNEKVDVYGFALVLWTMLAGEKVYVDYAHSKTVFEHEVILNGKRPLLKRSWPLEVQELLAKAWSQHVNVRPKMWEVSAILGEQVSCLKGDDFSGLKKERRHSSEILAKATTALLED